MNTEVMKNMIVIKNLPSNIIEQAFIFLKPNLKVKELKADITEDKENFKTKKTEENYIVKEAELLVSEYISKIEKGDNIRKNSLIEKKYKKMKKIALLSLAVAIIGISINIFF